MVQLLNITAVYQKLKTMKKLLLTVLLAAACQFTFATSTFEHERGGYRHHEHGYYRPHNCFRPIMIAPPLFYGGYYVNPAPRIWIGGHWVFSRHGRQIWIPGHWSYLQNKSTPQIKPAGCFVFGRIQSLFSHNDIFFTPLFYYSNVCITLQRYNE